MRSLLWFAIAAASCLSPANAWAGLVFELDGIDVGHIDSAEVTSNQLTATSRGRTQIIRIPEGVGASLMVWAQQDTGGPLVLSIDGSLVSIGGDRYSPPSVPVELSNLLFAYDDYAHKIVCGATSRDLPDNHPLIRSVGERMMPHRRHETLLNPATRTPEAYAYRHLTERFVTPADCVGELSLYAMPGTGGRLVAVQPRSWIHMVSRQWYRIVDAPSESDKWVARLPYQPLKQDIEKRWVEYRSTFRALDSLSSIVEAMAVLRAIKREAPTVWTELVRQAPDRPPWIYGDTEPLDHHRHTIVPWSQLARDSLGGRIETSVEANLVLALAIAGERDIVFDGFDTIAANDPLTGAKLELAQLLFDRRIESVEPHFGEDVRRFFEMLSQTPHSFRLRVVALSMLTALAMWRGWLEDRDGGSFATVLRDQRDAVTNDFLRRAESACAAGFNDLVTWENLSQDVYSTGLLVHLKESDGMLPPRAAAAVACIHFHRAMVPQQGRQFAYRHAHYRFLKYLAKRTTDLQTRSQILQYRRALAQTMNLQDSDL